MRPHTFYLEWSEDGKRKREAVGKIGFEAIVRREFWAAQEAGIQITDPDEPRGTALAGAIEGDAGEALPFAQRVGRLHAAAE